MRCPERTKAPTASLRERDDRGEAIRADYVVPPTRETRPCCDGERMVRDGRRGAVLIYVGVGVVLLGLLFGGRWSTAGWAAGMTFVGAGVLLAAWSARRD